MTFGLIGYPLARTFSRSYFTEKFEELGLSETHRYLNFEVEDFAGFDYILDKHSDLRGCNVTIPHKQNVLPYLDELDEQSAGKIGAVNTILFRDGKKIGYNTDYIGFQTDLLAHWTPKPGTKALVLGTGGASLAIHAALNDLEIVTQAVSRSSGPDKISYGEVTAEVLAAHHLVVNTTPLGMVPNIETCPDLPYDALTGDHFCYDVVYTPEVTEFLRRGAARGAGTANGMGMLRGQAEAAWEIWTA